MGGEHLFDPDHVRIWHVNKWLIRSMMGGERLIAGQYPLISLTLPISNSPCLAWFLSLFIWIGHLSTPDVLWQVGHFIIRVTNAALSASKTTLQSALDAILAELAALQLSGSGGVVNAPAWAGFTAWELVRGSNVVRNLHLEAPLSAALANGDDTLSITADCYSIAAADAALAAALLAYYTSAQVDALLADYRTGAAQDAETTALLAYDTSSHVDALLGDYRTASAQDTQTQAAIAGALLAYRTGPDQDVFTTNQVVPMLSVPP